MVLKEIKVLNFPGLPEKLVIDFLSRNSKGLSTNFAGDKINAVKIITMENVQTYLSEYADFSEISTKFNKLLFFISQLSVTDIKTVIPELITNTAFENINLSVKFFPGVHDPREHWYFTEVTKSGFRFQKLSRKEKEGWVMMKEDMSGESHNCILETRVDLFSSMVLTDLNSIELNHDQLKLFEIQDALNSNTNEISINSMARFLSGILKSDMADFINMCRWLGVPIKDIMIDYENEYLISFVSARDDSIKMLAQLEERDFRAFVVCFLMMKAKIQNACIFLVNSDMAIHPTFISKVYQFFNDEDRNSSRSQILMTFRTDSFVDNTLRSVINN